MDKEGTTTHPDMMRRTVFLTLLLLLSMILPAQENNRPDRTGNTYPDSLFRYQTPITVPFYFSLLFDNAKKQVTAPFHTSKKDWITVGTFALLTGGVALLDKPVQRLALDLRNKNGTVKEASAFITKFGGPYETYTLATLAAYGLLFKKQKTVNTVLLATQAYLIGGGIESAAKYLTGRQRPNYYGSDSIAPRGLFHGPFARSGREYKGQTISSSFPSGHTTVAFAAATVFAMEYRDKPLIPVISYTAATLIGLSRITENKHWATDVLAGAALGYISGRQVVRNYHRMARNKTENMHLTVNYRGGVFETGILLRL
ncbi:MAG TPA: phosphatase PAP2 family protein [Flavisolibacter sp.]|jgi:membrane-associated phospholipid phosphatase|nr:phosphatase PAP2 family protein [Flavisolibacter sp.]